jgi:hypothetical protein
MFCIPLGWVGRAIIGFVGRLQKEDVVRSNPLTRFFLMLTPLSLGRTFGRLRPHLVCGITIPLEKGIAIPRNRRWRNGMAISNL